MKYLIFATLALLLLSQTAQAQEWEELNPADVQNRDRITRDLLDVAVGYVLQKGKFENAKAPFTGDYYLTNAQSIKYERRSTSTLTYFKYNFLLQEQDGPSVINATAVVSCNPSNSNFIVTSYSYKIVNNRNEGQSEEGTEDDNLIDTRTLTGDGDLATLLNDSFDEIVAGHIEQRTLPDDTYSISYVYRAYSRQFDGVENANQEAVDDGGAWPSQGWKEYNFWVKFKSSKGNYYLVMINIHYVKNKETGEFGPEIYSLNGDMKLDLSA